ALNIDAILFTKDCADPLYRRAIRVSMGNIFNIPWTIISNDRPKNMDKLKSLGFMTVSMALCENSIGIDDTRLLNADKLAIIMGTEGEGLSNEVIKASYHTAKIPMSNGVDSLNVAAASAVIFWELSKRDRP
ncbi:MAG: RNA methyltransferase, partial [Lachnospiraceae bacterium]|nr:RNA methyltransferase [Lachnospiraceae bacterium]